MLPLQRHLLALGLLLALAVSVSDQKSVEASGKLLGTKKRALLPSVVAAPVSTCVGRCGDPLDSSLPCQCNSACERYGDCCSDYEAVCKGATCVGRCGLGVDSSKPCQCNSACQTYGDCCPDYQTLCNGGKDLSSIMTELWNNDINRMPDGTVTTNYQSQTNSGDRVDRASQKLFSFVDERMFTVPTYQRFIAMLDNYTPQTSSGESLTQQQLQEIDSFLDAVLATSVMTRAHTYLAGLGLVSSSVSQFREVLRELWFNLYPRSNGGIINSSGFEHVMVGELSSSAVSGFHSWLQFYLEEKAGRLDYTGWVRQGQPNIIGAQFKWLSNLWKSLGSFFIGTSPEFDLAVFTVCALERPNALCSFSMAGHQVAVQTFDISHKSGAQIGSAYPSL